MSNPSPARYRTTNWSSYNAALMKRGSLLIWLEEMIWLAPHERGGSVCLNSFLLAVKWIPALVTPPPGLVSAG
jgi:uncharacterized membrane protein